MKKDVVFVLLIAVIVSAISVVSMINDNNNQSFLSFAGNMECSAQGDFQPEPFDELLIAPITGTSEPICSTQNENQTQKIKKTN
ncbi:MAG: hypothetical protein Q7J16_01200 [Candidatus Cloacimonadales bacterium]|nr:hypothetical protein [Candidatus Cloacimonadales bacterium]